MLYHTAIKDLPEGQRPREKLFRAGAELLTDGELLAILLRTGTAEASALDLAAHIISRFGGIGSLVQAAPEELSAIKGVGPAKAAQIKAALELGRRLAAARMGDRPYIKSPEDAAFLVMEEMRHLDREHFGALLLNTKNQVVARETVSIGTLNSSSVHPRELFKNAIRRSAAAIILVHNHPSGDPTPSREDIEVTRRLHEAGEIVGIEILDHIVIGDNKFTSFKAKGML
ncbi:DNA repair protein RadC [Desulfocucumis palustris]|uniref:DNA repair protein RadC n=1 Tax=Desulfocucumis palustris TaxID=1898651 RepID=A0A2L2XFV5_9FIRM|nr:DNA repair protein RadC [Desulfocucumis palustris]GBF34894.1 DNA repair protein RadC [Desulfocucumis palustris]